jgi:hypothetical protein
MQRSTLGCSPLLLGIAIALAAASLAHPAAAALVFGRPAVLADDPAAAPTSATDRAGTWLTAWSRSGRIVVSRSTDDGRTWSAPVFVTPVDPKSHTRPRLATDGQGTWVVTWQSAEPYVAQNWVVLAARSTDGGLTWSLPTILSDESDGDWDLWPVIATDGAGTWVVAWEDRSETLGWAATFARSTDGAVSWSAPAPVDPTTTGHRTPTVATDGSTWLIAWEDSGDIIGSRSLDGGATWSGPTPINSDAGLDSRVDYDPDLATDGQGTWIAAWTASLLPIQFARSTDGGVTWTTPAALDLQTASNGSFVQTVAAGNGEWAASWGVTGRALGEDGDVLFAHSNDGGTTWSVPLVLNDRAYADHAPADVDRDQTLVTDGAGHWVATWASASDSGAKVMVARNLLGCDPTPRAGCKAAVSRGAAFKLLADPRLVFRWRRGDTVTTGELGQPADDDEYDFCVYDEGGVPTLVVAAGIPAGGLCRTDACWRSIASGGFKYRDVTAFPQGIDKVVLKPGLAGRASVVVGAGRRFPAPTLPLGLPARIQVQASGGTCWEAVYSAPSRNDTTGFIATSD